MRGCWGRATGYLPSCPGTASSQTRAARARGPRLSLPYAFICKTTKVNPQGRASQTGLQQGDEVVAICHTDVTRMTHNEVKREILRAGNELDLTVRRGGLTGPVPPQQRQRVEVCEEPTQRIGGPTYKPVQPKTYKVLDEQLASGQAQEAKPSSIFDRNRQERSAYLQAKGCTIQKAFGEG